jgi:hypothetical protein
MLWPSTRRLAGQRKDARMRVVGNLQWQELAASPQEAMQRGVRLDALTRLPGMPDFQPRGVFRGSHAYFAAMDEEKARNRQAWFQRHAKRPA